VKEKEKKEEHKSTLPVSGAATDRIQKGKKNACVVFVEGRSVSLASTSSPKKEEGRKKKMGIVYSFGGRGAKASAASRDR